MLGGWYGGEGGHNCGRELAEVVPTPRLVDVAALSRVPCTDAGRWAHVHERRRSKTRRARMLNRLSCSVVQGGGWRQPGYSDYRKRNTHR